MKRTFWLAVVFVALAADNPMSIPCDLHTGQTFYKNGTEIHNGQCFDVYTHPYGDNNCICTRTHKVLLKCSE